jgi:hypothetical protein
MSVLAQPGRARSPARTWLADLAPVAMIGLYAGAVSAAAARAGELERIAWTMYLPYAGPATACLLAIMLAAASLRACRLNPGLPLAVALPTELEQRGVQARSFIRSLPLLAALPVFLSLFSSYKALIPELHPFAWDLQLAEWDRSLHLGLDPWRYLAPLLQAPVAVKALDLLYHPVWSLLIFGMWTWMALDRSRPIVRMQLLLSLPATWILAGSVAATVFSSAGPCYFGEVGGEADRFGPLLDRLAAIHREWPLMSHMAQEALWARHVSGGSGFGSGISAMPSVHVASAFLLVLLARHHGPGLLAPAAAYFAAILAGSVLLGWHYALDSYAGAALAWATWAVCGAVARKIA